MIVSFRPGVVVQTLRSRTALVHVQIALKVLMKFISDLFSRLTSQPGSVQLLLILAASE